MSFEEITYQVQALCRCTIQFYLIQYIHIIILKGNTFNIDSK